MNLRIGYGLGIHQMFSDAQEYLAIVDALEALRFDSLWLSERIAGPTPDPVVGLAVAAGRTRRLKLGTNVLVLPGRNPALIAKQLATLDQLSGGRLLLAFGLGTVDREEQDAFAIERHQRGAWFEEMFPLLAQFWTGEPVSHQGDHFSFTDLRVLPRPVQRPLEPWLGGRTRTELRRTGRLGDGWLASFLLPEETLRARQVVQEAADEAGRTIDPEHFGSLVLYAHHIVPERLQRLLRQRRPEIPTESLIPTGTAALRDCLEEYLAAGLSKFILIPAERPPDWLEELERVDAEILDLQGRR